MATQDKQPTASIKHDGMLTLATGRSRTETRWKTQEMLWSALVKRLSETARTSETVDQYDAAAPAKRDEIKDVGGFVGGALSGGRRKAANVAWRTLITLDADNASPGLWDTWCTIYGNAAALYSTHSHTKDKPRLRLVIPVSEPLQPDAYQAVARMLAQDLGIDQFDDTTYEPHRLMYWPSTPSDGNYTFQRLDSEWLNPQEVLSRYADWTDQTSWPESSRETGKRQKLAEKQGDPLAKPGMVGAFCRAYTIPEAIAQYLSDVYAPVDDSCQRYTYIPGSSTGGLVIYDDRRFAYSHHGTDPVGSQLVNAFDLVRLHKYSDLDDKAAEGTQTHKLPSYAAMQELAQNDERVRIQLGKDRLQEASEDFDVEIEDTDSMAWVAELEITKEGRIKDTLTNLVLILREDPHLSGIRYDQLLESITVAGKTPWPRVNSSPEWRDEDDSCLRAYIDKTYKLYSPGKLHDAIAKVTQERAYHPVRDYLNALEWDGTARIEGLLPRYLGVEDTVYTRDVMRKTLVAAVARVMQPGVKWDYMPILIGDQGLGKSTLFAKLAGPWFNDNINLHDMSDKSAAEKLKGFWIIELSELVGMRHAESEAVKSFLSRQNDIYRPSYGRRTVTYPRQCIFVGTSNSETGVLRDTTGNRRFWPIDVPNNGGTQKAWDMTSDERDQIWAEAVALYEAAREPMLLTGVSVQLLEQAQKRAIDTDDRQGMVEDYLDQLLPEMWSQWTLGERKRWLASQQEFADINSRTPEGKILRTQVCALEIWAECFGKDIGAAKRYEIDDIHRMMQKVPGWIRYTGNQYGKMRVPGYGIQRVYVRDCNGKATNVTETDKGENVAVLPTCDKDRNVNVDKESKDELGFLKEL